MVTQRKIHCCPEWKWWSFESHFAFCVTQLLAHGINSRMIFSSTYSTRRGELLLAFCNGNSTQNSLPPEWKWWLFESYYAFCVTQQFAHGRINSRTLFSSTYSTPRGELLILFRNGNLTHNSLSSRMKVMIVWVLFCVLRYAIVCSRD
jgi:hypothetical protein